MFEVEFFFFGVWEGVVFLFEWFGVDVRVGVKICFGVGEEVVGIGVDEIGLVDFWVG